MTGKQRRYDSYWKTVPERCQFCNHKFKHFAFYAITQYQEFKFMCGKCFKGETGPGVGRLGVGWGMMLYRQADKRWYHDTRECEHPWYKEICRLRQGGWPGHGPGGG